MVPRVGVDLAPALAAAISSALVVLINTGAAFRMEAGEVVRLLAEVGGAAPALASELLLGGEILMTDFVGELDRLPDTVGTGSGAFLRGTERGMDAKSGSA